MYLASVFMPSKKLIVGMFFVVLSVLLAAYAPMSMYAHAESVVDSELQTLKQKTLNELNRRIDDYKSTLQSLDVDVSVNEDNDTAKSASAFFDQEGFKTVTTFESGFKDNVKKFQSKMINMLSGMAAKVKDATSLSEMQSLGKNIDAQAGVNQLTNVQSAATQAIQSASGVFGNLKSSFSNVKSKVQQMKVCMKQRSGDESSNATTSPSPSSSLDSTPTPSAADCEKYKDADSSKADQADSLLNTLQPVIKIIGSVLSSIVALVTSLFSSYSGLLSGMGGGSSLNNLGNLGSLLGDGGSGGLNTLTGSSGSVSGLLSSFTSIIPQLSSLLSMGTSVSSSLGSTTSMIPGIDNIAGLLGQ